MVGARAGVRQRRPRRGYLAAAGGFDELVDGRRAVKPHWQPLLQALSRWIPRHARCAWSSSTPACAKPASPTTSSPIRPAPTQPWRIDLVPLIIGAEEWHALERRCSSGRACSRHPGRSLWTPAAADLRRHPAPARVQRSLLPAPLQRHPAAQGLHPVLRHRPCARTGRALARDRHAHRDAGRHRLCARQPHGAHQRRRRRVRCLQGDAAGPLLPAAAGGARPPRRARRPAIALLTPGPRHNDFFSHAYLARYLGLLLVEGGDLRVTGDRVSLKTLHGLMPIDLDRALRGRRASPTRWSSTPRASRGPSGSCRPCASIPTSSPTCWAPRSPRTAA